MRIVFLGAPGVGKGTQAELISSAYHIPKISTGDLLRSAVSNQTPLGLEAKQYMDRGDLVPDKVVIGLVEEKIGSPEGAHGFILDGFPRTVAQADELSRLLEAKQASLDKVIYFMIPRDEIVRRLSGRRSCSKCPAVFHVEFVAPQVAGQCDECGGELIQRNDDKQETVESRLSVYEEQTMPLIQYYKHRSLLEELDGSGAVETVHSRLLALFPAP